MEKIRKNPNVDHDEAKASAQGFEQLENVLTVIHINSRRIFARAI